MKRNGPVVERESGELWTVGDEIDEIDADEIRRMSYSFLIILGLSLCFQLV